MKTLTIIILAVIILLLFYAISKEIKDTENYYKINIPKSTDNITILYKKLLGCVSAELKTVKWRKSFINAFVCLILVCVLIKQGFPTIREIFLYLIIIYTVYYMQWVNHNRMFSSKTEEIAKKIIKNIQKVKREK